MSSSLSLSLSSPFIYDSATSRHGINLFPFPHTKATPAPRTFKSFPAKCSPDNIPKQFRQENLKDGVMDNFKNAPQFLYGLSPSQMDMFKENSIVDRLSQRVTEESISSKSYFKHSGIGRVSRVSMFGGGGGIRRPRRAPPDLPSMLLDARILYLGMPIVPAVTELIVAQLMWLDYDKPNQPIYLYINSSGTQNESYEVLGSETDAYAIADTISHVKPEVYTVNLAMAFGQAAMLLSIGKKGYRALLPNSITKLYLPKVHRSSGCVSDMWIEAKDLEVSSEYYIELVAKGTGKSKEEIAKHINRPKYFNAQEAVDYGLADRIMYRMEGGAAFENPNYPEMLAERALKRPAGSNPPAAPSGLG